MGCCSSTAAATSGSSKQRKGITHSRSDGGESRAPPPTVEEETVKEVLSETPRILVKPKVPKAVPNVVSNPDPDETEKDDGDKSTTITTPTTPSPKPVMFSIFKLDGETKLCSDQLKNSEEMVSEVSEICSLSESASTTTNLTRDDDVEVGHNNNARVYRSSPMRAQLPKHRSLSGELGAAAARREQRIAGKSPSRRPDQSPGQFRSGNAAGPVRMVQTTDPGGRPLVRRGLTAAENNRRDGSARRSRSPAMTRAEGGGGAGGPRFGVGRSPSAKRAAGSPGRVNGASVEINRRVTEDPKWSAKNGADESLENPLVSLECFIFL